jgi:hypothetical protein
MVPSEITVINEVPARIFPLGTLYLIVVCRGTYFIGGILTGSLFFQLSLRKYRSHRVPWK